MLEMGGRTVDLFGHDSCGSAIDQGFSQVPLIKHEAPVHRWDAGFVAAVLYAFPDSLKDPQGMEYLGRQLAGTKRVCKTEHVRVEDELGPHAGAEGVAVDPHDAGERAAVWVQGRRGVVGLHLEHEVIVFIEPDNARIVGEDAHADVFFPCTFTDLGCGALDVG